MVGEEGQSLEVCEFKGFGVRFVELSEEFLQVGDLAFIKWGDLTLL